MWSAAVHQAGLLLSYLLGEQSSLTNSHEKPGSDGLYTGPYTNGGAWAEAYEKAKEVVAKMDLAEKVNLTTATTGPCQANSGGVPRLGVPGMCFNDGPSGPRHTDFVTQFPSAFTAAASFDRDLIEERAVRIGHEFRGKGVNVELGPVIGQALSAAARTIKAPLGLHSQHCYFLSPALNMPIRYDVERLRDGKSYATRLVKAIQHDKPVFILIASYTLPPIDLPPLKGGTISPFSFTPTKQALSHSLRFAHGSASESEKGDKNGDGYERPSTAGPGHTTDDIVRPMGVSAKYEIPFPDCIAPYEECEEEEVRWQRFMDEKMGEGSKGRRAVAEYIRERKESPVSIAVARVSGPPEKIAEYGLNKRMLWLRPRLKPEEKPSLELVKAMIAYMSDFQYIGVASRSVGLTRISQPRLGMLASLDHSTHFYPIPEDFDPSSPILHVMEAAIVDVPSGRGVVRGLIYTQSGVLLATTSQEGVVRADLGKAEKGLVEGRGVGEEEEAKAEVKAKL